MINTVWRKYTEFPGKTGSIKTHLNKGQLIIYGIPKRDKINYFTFYFKTLFAKPVAEHLTQLRETGTF